jgi:hypothetical protein
LISGEFMKPKKQEMSAHDDLFRLRLEQILDQRHALYRLVGKVDWTAVEPRFADCMQRKDAPEFPSGSSLGCKWRENDHQDFCESSR